MKIILLLMCVAMLQTCREKPVDPPDVPTKPDTTSHNFSWSIDTIGTWQSYLSGVWGVNPNNVYAVGFVYWAGRSLPVNIIHWNGENWQPIDYTQGDLYSVFGFSANDIWAVGYWQVDNNGYPLIAHWNGSQWQTTKLNQLSILRAIWGTSSNNMYAVGTNGLIIHYNGTQWIQMQSNTLLNLYDITALSSNEIYIVGGSSSTDYGVMLMFKNNMWEKIFERGYSQDTISGLVSTITKYSKSKLIVSTGAEIYLGSKNDYTRIDVPTDNTFIEKIRGSDSSNIFMCGSFGMMLHWNGKSWKRYDEFYRKPYGDFLTAVWTMRKNVFVVGISEDYRGIIFRGKN